MTVEKLPKKLYLVTRTQTVKVEARNEAQAEQLGDLKIDFNGSETTDIQAEVIDDA